MKILISGGASGLGEAITRALAGETTNTVYFTFNSSETKATEIQKQFNNTVPIKCDFKNREDVVNLRHMISTLDLDILINNAFSGQPIKNHFHKIPVEDFTTEFQNNIIPTVEITQAVLTGFRKKKSGKIITVLTSFLLNTPPAGASVYVAVKAYLASLVKSWSVENSKFNIASNSISPSFMLSNLTKDVDERVIEQMIDSHPLKRLLSFEEVAEAVLFLSKASPQLNGVDIPINAGTNIK